MGLLSQYSDDTDHEIIIIMIIMITITIITIITIIIIIFLMIIPLTWMMFGLLVAAGLLGANCPGR